MAERKQPNANSEHGSDYIKCPLFVAHGDRTIVCRPLIPTAYKHEISFPNPRQKQIQQLSFCEQCYERCEYYQSWLHFQWDDDND